MTDQLVFAKPAQQTRQHQQVRLILPSVTGNDQTHIVVNGRDITAGTAGVTLSAFPREATTLMVNLAAPEVEVNGEMKILIPDETRDALIALGWTPPGDGDA